MGLWDGAGGAIAGSVLGGLITNQLNKDNTREQMRWQERLSSNAHQREVRDLRAAGLNPILSALRGSGASTPSGSVAQTENVLGEAVSSGLQARRLKMDIEQAGEQINLAKAQQGAQRAAANRDNTTAAQVATDTAITKATAPYIIQQLKTKGKEAEINEKMLVPDAVMKRINDTLGAISTGKDALRKGGEPGWIGTGTDGTKYHKKTGEILKRSK